MQRSPSREVARAAIQMALTDNRQEEGELQEQLRQREISAAAVDFGGDFVGSIRRIVERAVVAAKREGVIAETHADEGAVAGATHEALAQISAKAVGLGVGGKVGIARKHEHLAVAIFFGVGLLHLDEVAIGLGHRAVALDRAAQTGR